LFANAAEKLSVTNQQVYSSFSQPPLPPLPHHIFTTAIFRQAIFYHPKPPFFRTLPPLHRKKKVYEFPVPSRDVTTKLSLGGNNDVITELFLPRGSLVSDIPAGDGKLVNLFYGVLKRQASEIEIGVGSLKLKLSYVHTYRYVHVLNIFF
jgi:hypothetical protein